MITLIEIEDAIIQILQDAGDLEAVSDTSITTYGDSLNVALEDYLKAQLARFPLILVVFGGVQSVQEHDIDGVNYQETQNWGVLVADRNLGSEQFARRGQEEHGTTGTYALQEMVRDLLHNASLGDENEIHKMKFRSSNEVMNANGVSAYALTFQVEVERTSAN
jgi:phage gp37-like protein